MSLQPVDVEAALVGYLSAKLSGVTVATVVQNPTTDEFVRVNRTGGARQDVIEERPTMLFECWASSGADAMQLAAKCWRHVNDCSLTWVADGAWCSDSQPSSPINFPDPTYSTRHRYQFYAPMTFALKEIS